MGAYSFFRTVAGLSTQGVTQFAHGLGLIPDYVVIEFRATPGSASTAVNIATAVDATNVTLTNQSGLSASPNLKIAVIHAHSIVT